MINVDISLEKLEILNNYKVMLYFSDGKVKVCDASEFINRNPMLENFKNEQLFKERCCIINNTMAFDIEGNKNEYKCYDIALEYLYLEFPTLEVCELYRKIKEFKPINDDWVELEYILDEVYEKGYESECLGAMFRLYEKYSEEDNDVLWGMLHGIESINGYEERIQWSLKRNTSVFVIIMINRLLNDQVMNIQGQDLISTLEQLKDNDNISGTLREVARRFYQNQTLK
ncbi:DUF2442 domain-containing protein [Clostridium sporogenes]|uniref:DUF2442 domain-containing protein n=1 Tax=Clostridium sporogenes TaxID=1509 RepID=UPI002236FB08|nr:DUF2442 domain-containing protein [Clostridium sporogenes]MCW6078082.1 DUF2442 domain-containing protein [Clostridium sporogenes]